jgi:hypothetical protein
MDNDEKRPSGAEKSAIRRSVDPDAEAIERLRQLREKLLSNDVSTARVAGFNLSWMQEDGLAILKEVLFGEYSRTAKKAAAYGLRSMHGRMKTMGKEILTQGLGHSDRITREACAKSLDLMKGQAGKKPNSDKQRIEDVQIPKRPRTQSPRRKKPSSR